MSKDNAIEIYNLTKKYKLSNNKDNLVLNGVTHSFIEGSVTAISGVNGSGKSTLLRIISGLTKPNSGEVIIKGKLVSIIELGSGFHHDLTGYENVFFYAQILGCSKPEVKKVINEIIAFSEIENYIHEPVKTYSKGMFLRLAYSIVAHLDFDIYLFDEVFAVGDKKFQGKCIANILEKKKQGKTMIITGHQSHLLASVCDNIIMLEEGKISQKNDKDITLLNYITLDNSIAITNFCTNYLNGYFTFLFNLECIYDYEDIDVVFHFQYTEDISNHFIISTLDFDCNRFEVNNNSLKMSLKINSDHFNIGKFSISIFIVKNKNIITRTFPNFIEFEKESSTSVTDLFYRGAIKLRGEWSDF